MRLTRQLYVRRMQCSVLSLLEIKKKPHFSYFLSVQRLQEIFIHLLEKGSLSVLCMCDYVITHSLGLCLNI